MASSISSESPIAVFQLQADEGLLQQVRELAAKYHVSVNRYVIDSIKANLAKEKEREWREGFEAMGRDADVDAEYMLPAAREVIVDG